MTEPAGTIQNSKEKRKKLAVMITRLFRLWDLSTSDQLNLLGLSPNSRTTLSKYAKGEPLSNSRDKLDRVGWLLSIHGTLSALFPSSDLRYSWIKHRNKSFKNNTPLEVMCKEGMAGLIKVSQYLDSFLDR